MLKILSRVPYANSDYYMSFEMGNYKHRMRVSAYLISPTIHNNGETICFSFWVFMFTSDASHTKIGSLSVSKHLLLCLDSRILVHPKISIWMRGEIMFFYIYKSVNIINSSPIQLRRCMYGHSSTEKEPSQWIWDQNCPLAFIKQFLAKKSRKDDHPILRNFQT